MAVTVVDNHHLSFKSTETLPADSLYKTYNFNGWIESTRVSTPSPQFTWTVNVYDTCAAFFEMVWSPFSNLFLTIGSKTSVTKSIAAFTQTLKNGKTFDP